LSYTFLVGCIIYPQCTASQTDGWTDLETDRQHYHASSRSSSVERL